MRTDEVGLFWQDYKTESGKRSRAPRPMPTVPDLGWRPPKNLPDLRNAEVICFDVEGYDPELKQFGPGWARGRGYLCGIAVAVPDASWYFPFNHQVLKEQNMPEDEVLDWARINLGRHNQPKVGANLTFDVGWLAESGVEVHGELHDVQYAEALLSETAMVSLETLGQKYLNEGKDTGVLYQWLADFYGGAPTVEQASNIYRAPASLVAPYAQQDVRIPLRVLERQWPELQRYGLTDLYRMECDLIPLMVAMRYAGVPVDIEKAQRVREQLLAEEKVSYAKLRHIAGMTVNVNAAASLAKAFDAAGLAYPTTAEGKPSFKKEFLATQTHALGEAILEQRKIQKARTVFVESYMLKANIKGIVYPQFHQLRSNEEGTRSGRFSSANPNYQNLPSRDPVITPLVRGCVVPDWRCGHDEWTRYDYSQIEYRFLAHFAVGEGSDGLRQAFIDDPETDYHEFVRLMINRLTSALLAYDEKKQRKLTKNTNFGLIYGMGLAKLALSLGLTPEQAETLFTAYHSSLPYVKATMEATSEHAEQYGEIRTILGRRSTFDLWIPRRWSDDELLPLPYQEAIRRYGSKIRRSHIHKALNRRLQGSAADFIKMAMLQCWKDGVYAVTGVPRLTVHDELDHSRNKHRTRYENEAWREMDWIMRNAMPLRVPMYVEADSGPDWGACT